MEVPSKQIVGPFTGVCAYGPQQLFAYACNNSIQIFDQTLTSIFCLNGHQNCVTHLCFSPRISPSFQVPLHLASCDSEGEVLMWSLLNEKSYPLSKEKKIKRGKIQKLLWLSKPCTHLLIATFSGKLELWDLSQISNENEGKLIWEYNLLMVPIDLCYLPQKETNLLLCNNFGLIFGTTFNKLHPPKRLIQRSPIEIKKNKQIFEDQVREKEKEKDQGKAKKKDNEEKKDKEKKNEKTNEKRKENVNSIGQTISSKKKNLNQRIIQILHVKGISDTVCYVTRKSILFCDLITDQILLRIDLNQSEQSTKDIVKVIGLEEDLFGEKPQIIWIIQKNGLVSSWNLFLDKMSSELKLIKNSDYNLIESQSEINKKTKTKNKSNYQISNNCIDLIYYHQPDETLFISNEKNLFGKLRYKKYTKRIEMVNGSIFNTIPQNSILFKVNNYSTGSNTNLISVLSSNGEVSFFNIFTGKQISTLKINSNVQFTDLFWISETEVVVIAIEVIQKIRKSSRVIVYNVGIEGDAKVIFRSKNRNSKIISIKHSLDNQNISIQYSSKGAIEIIQINNNNNNIRFSLQKNNNRSSKNENYLIAWGQTKKNNSNDNNSKNKKKKGNNNNNNIIYCILPKKNSLYKYIEKNNNFKCDSEININVSNYNIKNLNFNQFDNTLICGTESGQIVVINLENNQIKTYPLGRLPIIDLKFTQIINVQNSQNINNNNKEFKNKNDEVVKKNRKGGEKKRGGEDENEIKKDNEKNSETETEKKKDNNINDNEQLIFALFKNGEFAILDYINQRVYRLGSTIKAKSIGWYKTSPIALTEDNSIQFFTEYFDLSNELEKQKQIQIQVPSLIPYNIQNHLKIKICNKEKKELLMKEFQSINIEELFQQIENKKKLIDQIITINKIFCDINEIEFWVHVKQCIKEFLKMKKKMKENLNQKTNGEEFKKQKEEEEEKEIEIEKENEKEKENENENEEINKNKKKTEHKKQTTLVIPPNFKDLNNPEKMIDNLLERIKLRETRINELKENEQYKHHQVIAHELITLNQKEGALKHLLKTPNDNQNFVTDMLKSMIIAGSIGKENFQRVSEFAAQNLITKGKISEGIQLLLISGKFELACQILQSYGFWEQAFIIAKLNLEHDVARIIWLNHANHLIKNEQDVQTAIQIFLSSFEFEKVLELLLNSNFVVRAYLLLNILKQEIGSFQIDQQNNTFEEKINFQIQKWEKEQLNDNKK
ncbi:wd repeat-containing protein [Anaeramoeba flamelloides]|uniref:Wd repeat-containing protein n=1 Tax=Anaeramoeba flamelloides TaxID=1746091 RepID=A0AAV7YUL6_9EUKA|nr:wd repeat-containing protein [Anaeramoeba flamelloides]